MNSKSYPSSDGPNIMVYERSLFEKHAAQHYYTNIAGTYSTANYFTHFGY